MSDFFLFIYVTEMLLIVEHLGWKLYYIEDILIFTF